MLTTEVDPQCVLPVTQCFMPEEGEIPAGAAVGFGKTVGLHELMCHTGALFGGIKDIPVFGQQVDPGGGFVFVAAHGGAAGTDLADDRIFGKQMPGEREVVRFAPVPDLLHKGVVEQICRRVKEVHADFGEGFAVETVEQQRDLINDGLTGLGFVRFRQTVRPGKTGFRPEVGAGVRWFVREDAGDHVAEIVAEFFLVCFVRHADKLSHGIRVHGVQIGLTVEPGIAHGGGLAERPELLFTVCRSIVFIDPAVGCHDLAVELECKPREGLFTALIGFCLIDRIAAIPDRGIHFFADFEEDQFPHPEPGIFRDQSACGAGGPAVFVIEPGFQSQFFTFFHCRPEGIHVIFSQVRRSEPHAGMEEAPAHAHGVEHVHFPAHFFRVQFGVQSEKGRPVHFNTRRRDVFQNGIQHMMTSYLFGFLLCFGSFFTLPRFFRFSSSILLFFRLFEELFSVFFRKTA